MLKRAFTASSVTPGLLFCFFATLFYLNSKLTVPEQLSHLQNIVPDHLEDITTFDRKKDNTQSGKLKFIIRYYRSLAHLIGKERPEAWSLLGFCYFHNGEMGNAIAALKKAVSTRPDIFWFQYNLALIYLKTKDYNNARNHLRIAINTQFDQTLDYTLNSQLVYGPVYAHSPNIMIQMTNDLREAFANGKKLVKHISTDAPEQDPVLKLLSNLPLKPY